MTNKQQSAFMALIALLMCGATLRATSGAEAAINPLTRTLDFHALPTDAFSHARLKWSKDLFIVVDDDPGAPSLYMFDRSGRSKYDAMIQIFGAARVRIEDFAAAPDGSVWTCGHADSASGQRSFFLAHLTDDAQQVQIIRTELYRPWYLTVASDESLWTVGYGVTAEGRFDSKPDSLRHFDASGKLIASAFPTASVGLLEVEYGYLALCQDRLTWYAPRDGGTGSGFYKEISPSTLGVLSSYPTAPSDKRTTVENFALTPQGSAFAACIHPAGEGKPDLYKLDRNAGLWIKVNVPSDEQGNVLSFQGNDGESLVFSSPLDRSELKFRLQVLDPSRMAKQQ